MPIVARPGELGALTLPGHYESYLAIAGPTWRNEIDASVGLELGSHRPARHAKSLRCPVLVQIADFDRSAPPHAVRQGGRGGPRRGPALSVRPLRRLARQRLVRARSVAHQLHVPAPAPRRRLRLSAGIPGYPGTPNHGRMTGDMMSQ